MIHKICPKDGFLQQICSSDPCAWQNAHGQNAEIYHPEFKDYYLDDTTAYAIQAFIKYHPERIFNPKWAQYAFDFMTAEQKYTV